MDILAKRYVKTQICNKPRHIALKCFYRFDLPYQNSSESQQSSSAISCNDSSDLVQNSQVYVATPEM